MLKDSLLSLVEINLKNGNLSIATKEAESLYKRFPENGKAILYLAICRYQQGKKQEAVLLLEKIKKENPEVAEVLESRWKVLEKKISFFKINNYFWNKNKKNAERLVV